MPERSIWVRLAAHVTFPLALIGAVVCAWLNAATWWARDPPHFPGVLFVGLFPIWLVAILILGYERRQGGRWGRGQGIPIEQAFPGVPRWALVLNVLVFVYSVVVVMLYGSKTHPGPLHATGADTPFLYHGRYITHAYLAGLRQDVRKMTSFLTAFYGAAALVTYGRRRPTAPSSQ